MIRGRWPELRAGLIAIAILLGLVDGCPLPPPADVAPWQVPIVELVRPVQLTVLRPFAWISRGLRFSQRWALFQVAPRERFRFEIAGRVQGGPWELLYRAGDPQHTTYADRLQLERVRGAWAPATDPRERITYQYPGFARWLAQRILDDHPDLHAVRLQFEKIVIERGAIRETGVFVYPFERVRGTP